ncbi:MAG TPA: hypothetical protein VND21_01065 [Planctomycetota bacterium]|nr:hypothetical protein [Planctomycetota bacterium]
MARAPRRSPTALLAALLCAGGLGALAVGACSKPAEVVPADAASEARFTELEKEMQELRKEREASGLAASVTGNEASDLRRTIGELQDKVRGLEARLAATPTAAPAGAPVGEGGEPVAGPAMPLPSPATIAPAPDGTFTEDQVANFRKLSDEADRRKSEEAQSERVKRELARTGVTLTPEQEAAVLSLQKAYATKMRDVFRGGPGATDADRQAAMLQRDALRNQYETDLRAMVPSQDADKIVEAMRRGWPGFFPRRMDRNRGSAGADD